MASDEARRRYWADQLERGYDLVRQIQEFPVAECGEGFASLKEAAVTSGVEMRFSTSPIAAQMERVFWIRESLVPDVIAIARTMNERGWILKIEDGYRSLSMQKQLGAKPEIFDSILKKCVWENGGTLPTVEQMFRRGSVLVANVPKVGTHMSGTAIDISVFRACDGTEVWRGNSYLEMSERTPMRSPFIEPEALENRLTITAILESRGFMHFPFEFWHYNKDDALGHILTGNRAPARFGPVHWDSESNTVTSVENSEQPLRPLPDIEREIHAAIARATQPEGLSPETGTAC
jgi:D-alanyl-D-alanine dipeptidase